jgi:hypothetical protein
MKKKGQITLFIIIGIVMLFVLLLLIYAFNSGFAAKLNPFLFSENSLKSYVTGCIEQETDNALHHLGVRGMYIYVPDEVKLVTSMTPEGEALSYTSTLLKKNQSYQPSIQVIQEEISQYIEDNLLTCLDDFSNYKDRSINMEYGEPEARTVITVNSIAINLHFPITAKKGDSQKYIDDFNFQKADIRLPYLLEIVSFMIDFFKEHPRSIDMTVLKDYNVDIAITPYDPMIFVVMITDEDTLVHDKPYNLRFALSAE